MCKIEEMKEMLVDQAYQQVSDIHNANYLELGAAIDMIKDLCEAMYYCTQCEEEEEGEAVSSTAAAS